MEKFPRIDNDGKKRVCLPLLVPHIVQFLSLSVFVLQPQAPQVHREVASEALSSEPSMMVSFPPNFGLRTPFSRVRKCLTTPVNKFFVLWSLGTFRAGSTASIRRVYARFPPRHFKNWATSHWQNYPRSNFTHFIIPIIENDAEIKTYNKED